MLGKFFFDFPRWGAGARAYRDIQRQMAERSEDCLTAWGANAQRNAVRDEVSAIIQEWMEWPHRFYLPNDHLGALLFFPCDMSGEQALQSIADAFSVPDDLVFGFEERTYGELVDALVEVRDRQRTGHPISVEEAPSGWASE
ncbi:MAG: hypothetical protein JXQ73_08890 [Phycisphaerae bacterium]|nr:hypothetical protein [Phycisphaerae bacterium]